MNWTTSHETRRKGKGMTRTTYSEYAPTQFDCKGLGLPDRQDWLVLPTMRTRDSEPLEESNFVTALEMMGGKSETVEVHRFGHWGPGWFEIILADPMHAETVERIESSLEDYPILDESDLSQREYEAEMESWEQYGRSDFRRLIVKHFCLSDPADWALDEVESDELYRVFCEGNPGGTNQNGDGVSGRELENAVRALSRGDVARLIQLGRKTERERKAQRGGN